MSTVSTPLTQVATDFVDFESQLKSDFGTFSTDTKKNLLAAFAAAKLEGSAVFSALHTAVATVASATPAATK
jgi:hypothetical protein